VRGRRRGPESESSLRGPSLVVLWDLTSARPMRRSQIAYWGQLPGRRRGVRRLRGKFHFREHGRKRTPNGTADENLVRCQLWEKGTERFDVLVIDQLDTMPKPEAQCMTGSTNGPGGLVLMVAGEETPFTAMESG
jgi:hypothetical protein